jgi:probable phosphoglycerate mutase
MPLYLIRHGESTGNVQLIFQGQRDAALTALGEQQAVTLGRWLAAQGVQPVQIHSSPLQRAWRTAQLLAEQFGTADKPGPALLPAPGLREYHGGQLEGLNEKQQEEQFPGYLTRPLEERGDFGAYGGETYSDMQQRLTDWLAGLDRQALEQQDILAVGHGGSLYQLLKLCCAWPVPRHFQVHISNCCCFKLRPRLISGQQLMILEWMVPLELVQASLAPPARPADDPGLE